jgi:hypothetical protein
MAPILGKNTILRLMLLPPLRQSQPFVSSCVFAMALWKNKERPGIVLAVEKNTTLPSWQGQLPR